MIDGVSVPVTVARAGTNPTALVQAGSIEIGATNSGANPFPGKLAQVAIFSAKVTQANMRSYMSQTPAGTETSLVSAYSFNNSLNDLNTTNANNLTAQGSAAATNADSPFGTQGDGSISSTLEYAIVQAISFSTDTTVVVQVPEGCMIPTSGTISDMDYSGVKTPIGFPSDPSKWTVIFIDRSDREYSSSPSGATYYSHSLLSMSIPIGAWKVSFRTYLVYDRNAGGTGCTGRIALSTSTNSVSDIALLSSSGNAVAFAGSGTGTFKIRADMAAESTISLAAATTYYLLAYGSSAGSELMVQHSTEHAGIIRAINGYL
jgi:hypothetical protein